MYLIITSEGSPNNWHKREVAVSYTHLNISIINVIELERIQKECGRTMPMLPVNNILVGATGRQNKT